MNVLKSQNSRIILPVSLICLFVLSIIWASYFRQRSFDRKDAIHFAVARNANLAVALEQYAIRTIRNADAVLQIAKTDYQLHGNLSDFHHLLESDPSNQDVIKGFIMIGADGRLKMADHQIGSTANFSNSSYFIFHAKNAVDSLLISKPYKAGNTAMILISRRLNNAQGEFVGIIGVQIQASTFTSFYAQARLLPNDIISLISPDGITYARRTGTRESWGEDISQSPLFKHVAEHPDSFYLAPDAIRHIPTWFSYRKLQDYPIIATVGSSEADVLADFISKQPRYMIPRAIISILVILSSIFSCLFLLHRRRLSERLQQEEDKYQRLLTEQIIAVQEREREWIGRELHDNVSQVLTTVKLYLETASAETGHPLIPRSMQLINSSITEIRNLSHQLSAPTLGTRSLIDSIHALIDTVSAFSSGIKFKFDHTGYTSRMTMSQKLAVYRILQEQLNNIMKHSEATEVKICLAQKDGRINLTVSDNGKGFDPTVRTNGMGINNIISRAKVFGGTVHIESARQQGYLMTVTMLSVPLEEEAVADFAPQT